VRNVSILDPKIKKWIRRFRCGLNPKYLINENGELESDSASNATYWCLWSIG
jgi:hypothetical protein